MSTYQQEAAPEMFLMPGKMVTDLRCLTGMWLCAGITVALATAAPQMLKPLVPSAEGLAAILMQVCHGLLCSPLCNALNM